MFDIIAAVFELAGKWLVISKNRLGFVISICGNMIWLVVACDASLPGLAILVIVASAMNVRGIIKWRK